MTLDLALVLVLLVSAIVMFIANRPRMDAVALLMIAALPFTGVITVGEALAGFADPAVVLIAALFVLGDGLVRTGVARRVGDWLGETSGGSETRLLVLLMLAAAGLGALMSGTAVVAIFIPIVLRLCQGTGASPRGLLMPLSMAALISGMITLVATAPNLVVNAELARNGLEGFGFFGITPFGVPILALGILYMLFARRLLAGGADAAPATPRRPSLGDWIARYDLPDREYRVRVSEVSPLAGQALETLGLREQGVNILAIERQRRFGHDLLRPSGRAVPQAGDVLLIDVQVPAETHAALFARHGLEVQPLDSGAARYFSDRTQAIGMVEALIPAESRLVGQTLLSARLRSQDGVTAIGLRRGRKSVPDLLHETLRVGDTLLIFGFWEDIRALQADKRDLVPLDLPAEFDEVLPAPGLAIQASGCLALTVALMVSGVVPNVHAALIGCLLMGLFRCIDLNSAYRAVSWKSIVLIAGMLPFSVALQRTGGVDLAADAVVALAGDAAPRVVLALLFAVTAVLGMFISNTATAVLMAPVAIAVAAELGVSPYPFAMTVALAASTAFMTPVSSPINTLVVAPGGYGFSDFVKVGVPFSLIVMVFSVLAVPLLLPLR
ncbi:MAG: SLC13 family permease [Acetobacteraceae bacterium]|nr:SLC13 family permease [Acetobacteraceae bacterium]